MSVSHGWLFETYQVVELDGGDTLVDTRDDLHGDGGRVDMLQVEAITEPRHTGGDLVELDALLAPICEDVSASRIVV
ncbi:hypothetical protein Tdes44962_MAKER06276 [Teratosphaeria destructans]|uniref:Uncharacterized protein n=1 Tax=Teratosphaeria destructans TaxID=418781 RepID=A0A9W7SIF3_9PEZI|nr:hypothetical protein Tdes44962_MAKER06276 [Teratosphaeria destructans]